MITRSNAASGRKARKEARAKAIQKFEDAFRSNLISHFPGLFILPRSCSNHMENLNTFVRFIKEQKLNLNTKKEAILHLNQFIEHINDEEKWQLAKAPQINQAIRRPSRRKLGHQMQVNTFRKWFYDLEAKLINIDMEKHETHLQCYILLSIITYGGLATKAGLSHLIKKLNSSQTPFETAKNWVWIDLVYKDPKASPNHRVEGEEVCLRRWFPDPHTLSLIHLYLSKEKRGLLPERDDEILKLFNDTSKSVECNLLPIQGANQLKQLCEIAYGAIELKPGISLPEYLIEVSTGRLLTSSLPTGDFKRLLGLKTYRKASLQDHPRLLGTTPKSRPNFSCTTKDSAYKELKELYKILNKDHKPKPTIAALQAFIPVFSIIRLLQNWSIFLLKERKIAVSSTYSYLSQIGSFLIYDTPTCDLSELASDDWLAIYENVIERKANVTERDNTAFRLMDFHQFHVSQNTLTPLDLPLITGKPGKLSFVKAGFIDEKLYADVRAAIRQSKALSPDEITRLEVLVILAHRTGIRIGELLKLTGADIEGDKQFNLLIRDNRFGKNKSRNAQRILPLWLLLPFEEYAYIHGFLCSIPSRQKHLVFHHDGQPQSKWNTGEISYLISRLLKSISGETHLSFHHFRHSALSKMQLIIEQDFELVETFTNHTQEEARNLFNIAFGGRNNSKTAFLHLAKMAGHGEADTTFKHYLHLTDLIWLRTVQKRTDRLASNQIKNLFAVSANTATRLSKSAHFWTDLHNHTIKSLKKNGFGKMIRLTRAANQPRLEDMYDIAFTKENLHTILYNYIVLGEELGSHWPENRRAEIAESTEVSKHLAEIGTKYNNPRFPSVLRKNTDEKYVLPFSDLRNCATDDLAPLLNHLTKLYKKSPAKVISFARDIVVGCDQSEGGVSFNHPNQLKLALTILLPIFPMARFSLTYDYPVKASDVVKNRIESSWLNIFQGHSIRKIIQVQSPRSRYMTARLKLLEKDMKKNQSKQQASRAIQNAVLEFIILNPEVYPKLRIHSP